MRNGQNKNRMRGRNRSKGQNPMTRVYESNGPDVKIRGTASHVADKYMQLARDSQSSGDPVAAENYYQHAEHYFRLIAAMQEQFRQQNPYYQGDQQQRGDGSYEDGDDDEGSDQPGMGASDGGYAPREHQQPQPQQQAYPPREPQPYMPREQRFNNNRNQQYGGRPPHQQQPTPQQQPPQPPVTNGGDAGDIDQLPAFVTGGAPQSAQAPQNGGQGQNGFESGGPDRFPLHRRRRRRHGPRPDAAGPSDAPSGPVGE
jgi:hypothetical protein